MKNVGWNVERNPGSEDLPENLVPGSDDDIELDDDFDQLSISSKKKETKEENQEEEELLVEESDVEEEEEDNMKNIDIYVEHGVFDPRNNFGTRSRVNFVAVLDSGVKLDSIEVFIDRSNNKVYLSGEYISTLRIAKMRMGDLYFASNCQQMESSYQTFLNSKSYQQTFKMCGKIPNGVEVENTFVDPETNLPVDDPLYPTKVVPDRTDGTATEAHIVHFYALVVQKETNGNGMAPRSRCFYNTRSAAARQQAPGTAYSSVGQGYTMPSSGAGWSSAGPPPAAPVASTYGHQPQATRAPAPPSPQARAASQAQARPPRPHRGQESVPQARPVRMVHVPEAQPEEEEDHPVPSARGGFQQPEQFSSADMRQAQVQFEIQTAAYRAAVAGLSSPTIAAYSGNESSGVLPATRRSRRMKVARRGHGYVEGHDVHSEVNNLDDVAHPADHHEHQSLTASQEIAEILDEDPML